MSNQEIANILRDLQGDRDQKDFASEVGISPQAYSMLLKHGFLPEASVNRNRIMNYLETIQKEKQP